MLIDWFTVGAQVLNFAILVWLLKRFLYKPILKAIDARETRIAAALGEADREKADAARERDTFKDKNAEFERQRATMLDEARADAMAERQTLMHAAHDAADALATNRQAALARDTQALMFALRQRAQSEIFAIAQRVLHDLAGADFEASACKVFITRLQELEGQPRDLLAGALSTSSAAVIVRSAAALPEKPRRDIEQLIADSFGVDVAPGYVTDPALVGGIELIAGGQKFAWSISDYLVALEREVGALIETQTSKPTVAT